VSVLENVKGAAAALTDALAQFGERAPHVAQLTVTVGGITVTVQPKPEPSKACPSCGRP